MDDKLLPFLWQEALDALVQMSLFLQEEGKMTEREYLLEMLCCLPKEVLVQRAQGNILPQEYWLNTIENEIIREAIEKYDEGEYRQVREIQKKYI